MERGTALITGGNRGIGYATALALAREGWSVAISSRDEARGQAAVQALETAAGRPVQLLVGDLSSIEGAVRLADAARARLPGLTVLIYNAGVWLTRRQLNADHLEMSFMVNHLAPAILGARLLDHLAQNRPARIVTVSAGLYRLGRVELERTPTGDDFHPLRSYANTKLWGLLGGLALARRAERRGVTLNAVHPGVVRTDLGTLGGLPGALLKLLKGLWLSPEAGADAPVWLATAAELEGLSGRYFDRRRPQPLAGQAQDQRLAGLVWERTVALARGAIPAQL